jgi:hypothetical protein
MRVNARVNNSPTPVISAKVGIQANGWVPDQLRHDNIGILMIGFITLHCTQKPNMDGH